MRNIIFVVMGLVITGCANITGTHNTDPANSIQITLPEHGSSNREIIGTLADGTKLVGGYSALSDKTAAINEEFAVAQKASSYSWTYVQGFMLKSTEEKSGLVLDCAYAVVPVPSLGHGRCVDNKGNTYRMRF